MQSYLRKYGVFVFICMSMMVYLPVQSADTSSSSSSSSPMKKDECGLCIDTRDRWNGFSCGHAALYHTKCLIDHLKKDPSCPSCKVKINKSQRLTLKHWYNAHILNATIVRKKDVQIHTIAEDNHVLEAQLELSRERAQEELELERAAHAVNQTNLTKLVDENTQLTKQLADAKQALEGELMGKKSCIASENAACTKNYELRQENQVLTKQLTSVQSTLEAASTDLNKLQAYHASWRGPSGRTIIFATTVLAATVGSLVLLRNRPELATRLIAKLAPLPLQPVKA